MHCYLGPFANANGPFVYFPIQPEFSGIPISTQSLLNRITCTAVRKALKPRIFWKRTANDGLY